MQKEGIKIGNLWEIIEKLLFKQRILAWIPKRTWEKWSGI